MSNVEGVGYRSAVVADEQDPHVLNWASDRIAELAPAGIDDGQMTLVQIVGRNTVDCYFGWSDLNRTSPSLFPDLASSTAFNGCSPGRGHGAIL